MWLLLQSCGPRFSHTVQQVPLVATPASASPHFTDSTITLAAGKRYARSGLHEWLYGKHYRTAWTTPVPVQVLDLGKAKGGLSALEMGGSRQTINLHLADSAGNEYVLRSIDKEPASSLPQKWQQSYLADIVRDATSATHPYAALTIPAMAKAIGIYYLEPELVYVPHDPRLGKYLDKVGGMMALLEKHPSGNQRREPGMGYAPEVENTRHMLKDRLEDNDTRIDAMHFLRSRLFDMLLGDWSRHEDNWRWAEYDEGKGKTYRGIPRDRDNVFYKLNDGPVPWLLTSLGLKPHFQTYREEISPAQVVKLNRSGRNLDELILVRLEERDWLRVADTVQLLLTDEVIHQAFRAMPDTVYSLTAGPLMAKLKARRQALPQIATAYYKELMQEVTLVGSDKHERFELHSVSPDELQVKIYKTSKEGKVDKLLLERTFFSHETKQIDFYGLDGNDHFLVTGEHQPAIKLKVWGGAGEDIYHVQSNGSKLGKSVYVNDSQYRNTYDLDKHTRLTIDNEVPANKFDAAGWLLRYYLD
ncbi:hypothetical protein [Pontibacter mangrovi]|uniref:Uncharacterized protein n=1 Tax=Pontibacter mangrovi TaxID=2589816 RepID=A0A501VZQ9_9BACT|nr:hypothetical protein [Pontibacter mangrovi]TPE41550.1 hypothetical protein FJM65_19320 [Pontibacter mangrovi]